MGFGIFIVVGYWLWVMLEEARFRMGRFFCNRGYVLGVVDFCRLCDKSILRVFKFFFSEGRFGGVL